MERHPESEGKVDSMRLFDWTNVLLVLAMLGGAASAVVLGWFGIGFVLGATTTAEGVAVDNPYTRTFGILFLVAATGCVVAAGYCTHMLWDKYREWRRWKSMPPGYSSWGIAKEAEERRKR